MKRKSLSRSPARLLREAAGAMRRAYCPYSRYPVGAALLSDDGRVFAAANVENASYGLTICAERAAFAAAVGAGGRRFAALVIVSARGPLPYPCGACRQVMREFCGDAFPVTVAHADNLAGARTLRLAELLPKPFEMRPKSRYKCRKA